ncbi:MAG: HlyD family type I secretion periplasmic adaptor subunit [Gammaproteobacteria bacterium]
MTSTSIGAPRIRSALFAIATRAPDHRGPLMLWVIVSLFVTLLVWSAVAQLDIVAVAEGRLVPQTLVKIVQPAEAGVLREIRVTEGQRVRKGQVLVRLDPTLAAADRGVAASQLQLKQLQLRRIEAQLSSSLLTERPGDDARLLAQVRLEGTAREGAFREQLAAEEATRSRMQSDLAGAREVFTKLEVTLPAFQRAAEAYTKLASEKLVGSLEAEDRARIALEKAQELRAQRETVSSLEAALTSQAHRTQQVRGTYASSLQSERSQLLAEVAQLDADLRKQGYREGLMELRAPEDGIVKELATTTLGAVVQPGTVLLSVVPQEEPLAAEIYIRNDDVGFVREGQPVRLKLAAYTFTKYGLVEGTVETISADAYSNAQTSRGTNDHGTTSDAPFKARVRLQTQSLTANGETLSLVAGMQVQAEIRQGTRSVLEYLVSPVQRVSAQAGLER